VPRFADRLPIAESADFFVTAHCLKQGATRKKKKKKAT